MYQPDKIDWKIINILRQGQVPNNSIARELGVSEGMVRSRLKRLKDAGILMIRAQINPAVLSNQQLGIVTVNVTESRLLAEKAKEISAIPEVLSVSIVSGRYDLVVEILVDSNQGLVRFLTESLSQVEGISKTESFVTLMSYDKFV